MSRTQEIINQANILLESNWDQTEKDLIKRMVNTLVSYKRVIPNGLKDDIKVILEIANKIKCDYEDLLEKYNKDIKNINQATPQIIDCDDSLEKQNHEHKS